MAALGKILLFSATQSRTARLNALLGKLNVNFELDVQALEHIGEVDYNNYSLVLLDAIQPNSNSLEFCNLIKLYCQSKIPVVMLGQDESLKTIVEAYKNGADYYIPWKETGEEAQLNVIKQIIQRAASQFGRVSA
ncbi:MAG: hypothetical protein JWP00_1793 [Chloroflexi bacterium]|jgi:DNA-binding response OmpR family regulator|nr:hypothetical protein [Chloroflexota bacterium]